MYKNHPSIIKINSMGYNKNSNNNIKNNFDFKFVTDINIRNVINNIDCYKAYRNENIPPKLLKENIDICELFISSNINDCIENGMFPSSLKLADITPIFKNNNRFLKTNYRPISMLHFIFADI